MLSGVFCIWMSQEVRIKGWDQRVITCYNLNIPYLQVGYNLPIDPITIDPITSVPQHPSSHPLLSTSAILVDSREGFPTTRNLTPTKFLWQKNIPRNRHVITGADLIPWEICIFAS